MQIDIHQDKMGRVIKDPLTPFGKFVVGDKGQVAIASVLYASWNSKVRRDLQIIVDRLGVRFLRLKVVWGSDMVCMREGDVQNYAIEVAQRLLNEGHRLFWNNGLSMNMKPGDVLTQPDFVPNYFQTLLSDSCKQGNGQVVVGIWGAMIPCLLSYHFWSSSEKHTQFYKNSILPFLDRKELVDLLCTPPLLKETTEPVKCKASRAARDTGQGSSSHPLVVEDGTRNGKDEEKSQESGDEDIELIKEVICVHDKICGAFEGEDTRDISQTTSQFINLIMDKTISRRAKKRPRGVAFVEEIPDEPVFYGGLDDATPGGPSDAVCSSSTEIAECLVCMSAPADTIILPCAHTVMCRGCWILIKNRDDDTKKRCIMCRTKIESVEYDN